MTDGRRVLIVEGRFYDDLADEMARGAAAVLDGAGVAHERIGVPGVFEVPAAIARAADDPAGTYSGFIASGVVIRGETDHYDHICREASRALMTLAVDGGIALGFGILTCESMDQAWVRAAIDQKNKGADAANSCLRMMELHDMFGRPSS
jgi:6,7-dimethyl-8-ribityllumazine synthase